MSAAGTPSPWGLIIGALVVLSLFVLNQSRNTREPLLPLILFKDRNFTLSNMAVASMAAAVNGLFVLAYLYLQVRAVLLRSGICDGPERTRCG